MSDLDPNCSVIPAVRRAEITSRIDAIAREEGAHVLLAIESGSRAWGFPSPDSDFDVRFFYTRKTEFYLGLSPPRDVVERPIIDDIDIGGWDLRKALLLLLKGNAVAIEWLVSPIVYREEPSFRSDLEELVAKLVRRPLLARHYTHLGRNALAQLSPGVEVRLKRYLYAVRPAAALLWLEEHGDRMPPMALPDLLSEVLIDDVVRERLDVLIEMKSRTSELGLGPRDIILDSFIERSLERGTRMMSGALSIVNEDVRAHARQFAINWTRP